MVKIICFSDTHGQHKSKELNKWFTQHPGDILIFAGDLQLNHFDDGLDFLNWIAGLPFKKKVITFGNHDGNYDILIKEAKKYKNDVVVLNHGKVKLFGINIFGSPYSINFMNWWFMKSEPELDDLYKKIPSDTNILITHTPAFSILDKGVNGYSLGSASLANRIEELPKLKYHICGHIHESYGKEKRGKVTHLNASLLNHEYQLVNLPHIFTI